VTVSDLRDGASCSGCDLLNGIYYPSYVAGANPAEFCQFHADMGVDPGCSNCGVSSMDLWVSVTCTGGTSLSVTVEILNDAPDSPWQEGAGDCVDIGLMNLSGWTGTPEELCAAWAAGLLLDFLTEQGGCDGFSGPASALVELPA
jgi:hypothetical protein